MQGRQAWVAGVDCCLVGFMQRWGLVALRLSLAVVYLWYGILKPLGMSPVDPLVMSTVEVLPVFGPKSWLVIIGWWEVIIGLCFLHRATIRLGLVLLAGHMVGAFMPLVVVPGKTFQWEYGVYAPTLQGQYIFKNLIVIAGAMVVGGSVGRRE